ncbi:unnamed protein product [Linum trigynum]|uniref:Uncharacterized protein n=1 Tax=Linum trigynum TaxID=586398 RepID=A0AAV2GPM2_9ROSI
MPLMDPDQPGPMPSPAASESPTTPIELGPGSSSPLSPEMGFSPTGPDEVVSPLVNTGPTSTSSQIDPHGEPTPAGEPPRRSNRERSRPKYLSDYDTTVHAADSVRYPLSAHVSYARTTPTYRVFLAAVTQHDEPKSFHEAIQHPQWREAMIREIKAVNRLILV